MPMLSLPPGLLLIILRLVGSRELQQDTGRLLISQKWYTFARIILVEDLHLTTQTLTRLETRRSLALQSFPGFQCRGLSISLEKCNEDVWRRSKNRITHSRRTPLLFSLQRLAKGQGNEGNLKTLIFEIPRPKINEASLPYNKKDQQKDWRLSPSSILGFLDSRLMASLRTLDLDLANRFRAKHATKSAHYCPSIAKLLPSLIHVRLRLPRICPDCFEERNASSQKQENGTANSRLRTLAVIVSVSNEWWRGYLADTSPFGVYSQCCRAVKAGNPRQEVISQPSWNTLLESLESLADRSPKLEVSRLTYHLTLGLARSLVAIDCLTGEKYKLTQNDNWTGLVKVDEDHSTSDEPSESEISSLDSDW
jgi:hypothetical protein